MEQVVIDTNIVVKLFIKEEYSDFVIKLKDSYINGDIDIVTNSLMKYEFINALKSKRFSSAEIKLALRAIDDYAFQVEEFSENISSLTSDLAEQYNLTSYDASYVALALILECNLYTADSKLLNKVPNLAFVKHIKEYKLPQTGKTA